MNTSELASFQLFATRLSRVTDTDIAWFAGWLCADGSIKVDKVAGRPKLAFMICDRDPLDRFVRLFGNSVVGPFSPSGFGKRPRWSWQITGRKAVLLLARCRPWMSERYLERAEPVWKYKTREHSWRLLNPQSAAALRKALTTYKHGDGLRLAKKFGVSKATVSAIRHGRMWAA